MVRRIALIIAAAVSGAVGSSGLTNAVAATGCGSADRRSLEADLTSAHARIQGLPGYAGIALLDPCGPIDVYRSPAAGGPFLAVAIGGRPAEKFRFHIVRHDLATLLTVQASVTRDTALWGRQGVHIHRYWPDMTTGLERIEVVEGSTSQLLALANRYGSDYVDPVSVTNPPRAIPIADPSNDKPPFSGADYIYWVDSVDAALLFCTSAFGVHSTLKVPQQNYMLTAGHCSARPGSTNLPQINTAWSNGVDSNKDGVILGSHLLIGTVSNNALPNTLDAALIRTPTATSKDDWHGWYTGASLDPQFSPQTPAVGQTVCVDGAYDGESCNAVIQQAGYLGCLNLSGWNNGFCSEIEFASNNGSAIVGEGDSGGPVYALGPEFFANGILSVEFSNNGGGLVACPHWTFRGNVCSSSGAFVDLNAVLRFFNQSGLAAGLVVNT